MAERRPPGFNIDLGFYDSAEVKSLPRRIRAAAVGVWSLCGNFSANKLQDGYVQAETLRDLGCTEAIRAALMSTIDADGNPSPLWVEAHSGGIQFTRWTKWQRTRAEVKAYRDADAERKRRAREGKAKPSSRDDAEMSGRTPGGPSQPVRPDSGTPKTETKTETKRSVSYVGTEPTDAQAQGISATPGANLVREIVPKGHPPATLTSLRLQASELLNTGTDEPTVRAALQLWCDKPGVGIGRTILASLCSEAIKSRTMPSGNVHQITAFDRKKAANAAVFQALATEPTHLEIEP